MADRSVKVSLGLDPSGFVAGTEKAKAAAGSFATDLTRSGRENADAYRAVGTSLVAVGAVGAVALGAMVKTTTEFEAQISAAGVATGATVEQLDALRDAGIDAGAETVFSARDAAAGITELGKAGLSTTQILGGGLSGALDLAAAGQLSVADAAEVTATTLKQFNLSGDDATTVADALAAGANKAVGSVSDLGMGLKQSGQVAAQFDIPVQEAVGALSAFASAGLLGSDAGTSFKTMLQRLAAPSGEAAELMRQLDISAYDASGNFVGLANFAGQLQTSLSALTPEQRQAALATIFGSDAVRAATVLYNEGQAGIAGWTETVSQSGFAAQQAAGLTDNLVGDLEALSGSVESLFITVGSSSQSPLRGVVQDLTDVTDAITDLPPQVQAVGVGLGAAATAVGLFGGAAAIAVPQAVELYDALGRLGTGGTAAQGAIRGLASFVSNPYVAAIGLGVAVVGGAFVKAQLDARQASEDLTVTLDKQTGAVTQASREQVAAKLQADGYFDTARKLGLSVETVTNASLGNAAAQAQVRAATSRVSDEFARQKESVDALLGGTNALGQAQEVSTGAAQREAQERLNLRNITEGYSSATADARAKVQELADATGASRDQATSAVPAMSGAGSAAGEMAGDLGAAEEQAQAAADALDALSDGLTGLVGQFLGVEGAADALQGRLNDLAGAAQQNGTSLQGTSDAALANRDAFRGLVGGATEVIDAMAKSGASSDELSAKSAELKGQISTVAEQAGFTSDEVAAYTGVLDRVPGLVQTTLTADTGPATAATQDANRRYQALKDKQVLTRLDADPAPAQAGAGAAQRAVNGVTGKTVTIGVQYQVFGGIPDAPASIRRPGYASGGFVSGPGPRGVDSVPAILAPGEYVLSASSVSTVGRSLLDRLNGGGVPRMADGGLMPSSVLSARSSTFGGISASPVVLQLRGDGSRYGEFLASELRRLVDVRGGGSVQLAIGRR